MPAYFELARGAATGLGTHREATGRSLIAVYVSPWPQIWIVLAGNFGVFQYIANQLMEVAVGLAPDPQINEVACNESQEW